MRRHTHSHVVLNNNDRLSLSFAEEHLKADQSNY